MKLVRDKIPDIMEADGCTNLQIQRLNDSDYTKALSLKLVEEVAEAATEIQEGNREGIIEELADLEEVRFLELDPQSIRFVIVGMEPYPTDYGKNGICYPIVTGRSFEVDNVTDWNQKFKQSSLRNILKAIYFECAGKEESLSTIRKEIEDGTFKISQPKEWFDNMKTQGVLFLNASLTVRKYIVNFHNNLWKNYMDQLISYIEEQNHPIWLLFGKDAQMRVLLHVDESHTICTCHPRLTDFIKEHPFKEMSKQIKLNC